MADGFFGPRSREHARLLLDAAEKVGVDQRLIRTTNGGYLVPQEVLDFINDLPKEGEVVEPKEEAEAETPSRPNVNEPKADWLAYAQHIGLDVSDETSKAEIIEAVKAAETTEEQK